MLDSPHGADAHFGGPVSAPIFKRIAEATLRYLGVPPSINPAPPVLVAAHHDESAPVTTAVPVEESPLPNIDRRRPPGTMPDVRGMSARDAMRKLVQVGCRPRSCPATAFVIAQNPAAGDPIDEGGVCRLDPRRARRSRQTRRAQP